MVHAKELVVLATIATLAQCQPSFPDSMGRGLASVFARNAVPQNWQEWSENLEQEDKLLETEWTAENKPVKSKPKTQKKRPTSKTASKSSEDPYEVEYNAEKKEYDAEKKKYDDLEATDTKAKARPDTKSKTTSKRPQSSSRPEEGANSKDKKGAWPKNSESARQKDRDGDRPDGGKSARPKDREGEDTGKDGRRKGGNRFRDGESGRPSKDSEKVATKDDKKGPQKALTPEEQFKKFEAMYDSDEARQQKWQAAHATTRKETKNPPKAGDKPGDKPEDKTAITDATKGSDAKKTDVKPKDEKAGAKVGNDKTTVDAVKDKPAAPKPATPKPTAPTPAAPKLRRSIDPWGHYGQIHQAERDLYVRDAYADAEAYALPYTDTFEFNNYANGLSTRDLYARDAYAEADPEAEINDILARDIEDLSERDVDVLFASLNERDLQEIMARFAEPEAEAGFEDGILYARDAEPEYELFERGAVPEEDFQLWTREAQPEEDFELWTRDAEAEAEADADAEAEAEAEADTSLAASGFISRVRSILGVSAEN